MNNEKRYGYIRSYTSKRPYQKRRRKPEDLICEFWYDEENSAIIYGHNSYLFNKSLTSPRRHSLEMYLKDDKNFQTEIKYDKDLVRELYSLLFQFHLQNSLNIDITANVCYTHDRYDYLYKQQQYLTNNSEQNIEEEKSESDEEIDENYMKKFKNSSIPIFHYFHSSFDTSIHLPNPHIGSVYYNYQNSTLEIEQESDCEFMFGSFNYNFRPRERSKFKNIALNKTLENYSNFRLQKFQIRSPLLLKESWKKVLLYHPNPGLLKHFDIEKFKLLYLIIISELQVDIIHIMKNILLDRRYFIDLSFK
jgi:hypothetical protein